MFFGREKDLCEPEESPKKKQRVEKEKGQEATKSPNPLVHISINGVSGSVTIGDISIVYNQKENH